MAATHLTDKGIRALKPRATVYRVRDTVVRGFGVTVAPSGARSYFLSYTSPETGARTQGTLGRHPDMSLVDARERATAWRVSIRAGVDPVLQEGREREAAQAAAQAAAEAAERDSALGTVADLFELYIRALQADGKRSATQVADIYRRDIGPAIGAKRARDVTADDIADLLAVIADRGALTFANRARSYLVAAFAFGAKAHRLPRWRNEAKTFDLSGNPARDTERALKREPRGQRWLSRDELRTVWRALDPLDIPTRCALRLLLSTGQRVEEVVRAEWSEFDRDQKLWVIPASRRKTGAEHAVPLTDLQIALLDELVPFSEGTRYLFPARGGKAPRTYHWLLQVVHRLSARLDMDRWTPRDARRTWKTLAGAVGIDLELRNRLQGHALTDVGSLHYDRHEYADEKRRAMQRWCDWLQALVSDDDAVVVPLRREAGR